MWFCRRRVGVPVVLAAALTVASPPPAGVAASLDACAQRVIRDWYSGARVDGVYPLACYRAALRALPDDVLQYSTADQDIRRALAFARHGREDPGDEPGTEASSRSDAVAGTGAPPAPEPAETPAQKPSPKRAPVANEAAGPPREPPAVAPATAGATSIPYPIVALAALSGVLLTAGALGWLTGRRR